MSERVCTLLLFCACVVGLILTMTGCVSFDLPIGRDGQYGRVSVGYFAPANFNLLPPDARTLGDK